MRLPQLYVGLFFTKAVEVGAELVASMRRLDAFLALPEPPPPSHATKGGGDGDVPPGVAVAFRGADFDWGRGGTGDDPLGRADAAAKPVAGAKPAPDEADDSISCTSPNNGSVVASVPARPSPERAADGPRSSLDAPVPARLALNNIILTVPTGELLGVCGEVGAGKSSLLLALLAELDLVRGAPPVVRGSVAYCAQVPYIASGSVRDNITFGAAYDADRYAAAVGAACLQADVERLPAADDTEIGERGINLSGGQKARLSLARAAYSGADVVLLDDPLSALDARVAAGVFDRCVGPGGMLAGSTRLLVTHARQFLPRCDRVAVMRGGKLVALGTHAELLAQGVPEVCVQEGGASVDAAVATLRDEAFRALNHRRWRRLFVVASLEAKRQRECSAAAVKSGSAHPEAVASDSVEAGTPSAPRRTTSAALRRIVSLRFGLGLSGRADMQVEDGGGGHVAHSSASLGRLASMRFGLGLSGRADRLVVDGDNGIWLRSLASMRRMASFGRSTSGGPESLVVDRESRATEQSEGKSPVSSASCKVSRRAACTGGAPLPKPRRPRQPPGTLTQAEGRASGGVRGAVYGDWFAALGVPQCALVAAGLIVGQAAYLLAEYWVSTLVQMPGGYLVGQFVGTIVPAHVWLAVYGGLTAGVVVIALVRADVFFDAALQAATRINTAMTSHVLRAPLSFFHVNPTGRVLNRFSKDQGVADDYLPAVAFDALQSSFMAVGALALMAIAVPWFLPVLAPLALAFMWYRHAYVATSRDIKRQEAVTRSPVFAALADVPRALPTLRAYGAEPRARAAFQAAAELNGAWWGAFVATTRWVGFRMDVIATAAVVFEAVLVTVLHSRVSARLAGLALSHAISLSGSMQWASPAHFCFGGQNWAAPAKTRQTTHVHSHLASPQPKPTPATPGRAANG